MAASLESRVPLLDYRIVDLMTRITPGMKFKGGELKHVFKKATKDLVPAKIRNRKDKMGFPVPLHIWAKGPAREFFNDVLLSPTARNRGLFNPRAVNQLMKKEAAFGRRLWGMLSLELWLREFIDSARPREVSPEIYATFEAAGVTPEVEVSPASAAELEGIGEAEIEAVVHAGGVNGGAPTLAGIPGRIDLPGRD
jgi:hypothetical protein